MAAKKQRSRHVVRNLILCILLLCVIAAAVACGLLYRKIKSLQQGAAFDLSYSVASTSAEAPVLYTILEKADATQGELYGVYAPGKLLLSLYQLSGAQSAATWDAATGEVTLHPDAKAAEPFTRIYIDSTETLYDAGQLYDTIRQAIIEAYPLASALLPEWSLGNYISQTQLATLLGVEPAAVEMQDMADFSLALKALKRVEPEGALDGFTYFQLTLPDAAADAPVLVLGVPPKALLAKTTPLHILLTIPQHSVRVELLGTLRAADTTVIAPSSRIKDEDIAVLAQIRQAAEDLLQFIQQATQSSG